MKKESKDGISYCDHDYKNAIQIGPVDYVCPKCKELINPLEWFLANHYGAKFIECSLRENDEG